MSQKHDITPSQQASSKKGSHPMNITRFGLLFFCVFVFIGFVHCGVQDCPNALVCISEGRCTLENDQCIAKTDRDCQGSRICLNNGECTA
ncbi:MAG TPA: hypothetical protein DCE42_18695, partial [Myxococcales bacterium]|nr:hypothetical protein [Myxococcales bacterium]